MTLEQLQQRLEQAYPDGSVEARDLTGGGDHYQVSIESNRFSGLTRIQQHQAVMAVFAEELKTGELHALSIKTKIKL